MCGFVGVIALDGSVVEPVLIKRMTDLISHRGPDDEGFYFNGAIALGFRRLAILDLSPAGHQPMVSADQDTVIVFNGEIYNYVELRDELQRLGHRFQSSGDTEVLLAAYRQWGADCLKKLSGMWAFLIYDRRSQRLFGSRDRFGMKPLYFARHGHRLIFASEIKSILVGLGRAAKPNLAIAADFLLEGRLDESDATFFEGIQSVRPACAFEVKADGMWSDWSYWSLPEENQGEGEHQVDEFRARFERSVKLHLRSDVPLGVHLSGGLDSTSILCVAARQRALDASPPTAFCFMSSEHDERAFIRETLARTGSSLVELESSPQQLWDMLPNLIYHHDEPVHSMTALVAYALNRVTKDNGVKVILKGDGADEVLAGYGNYFVDYRRQLLRAGHVRQAWRELVAYAGAHRLDAGRLTLSELVWQMTRPFKRLPGYTSLARARRTMGQPMRSWVDPEFAALTSSPMQPVSSLHDALAHSVRCWPLPLYLRVEDRNSMAHSIEGRMPFLDHALVELAFALPSTWKLRGPWSKFILRESMRGIIPESVRTRVDKMGFPTPVQTWIRGPLFESTMDIISSQSVRESGFFRVKNIMRDAARFKAGALRNLGTNLFDVAQFELWRRHAFSVSDNARSAPNESLLGISA